MMLNLPLLSIRYKLLGVILITTLTALLVAGGAMLAYDLRVYYRGWIEDISTQAELLGRSTAPALAFDDKQVAKQNLDLLRFRPKVRAAAIYNARGGLFAAYAREGTDADFPKLPEIDSTRIEGRDLVLFKRIIDGGEILGTVYVRADYEFYSRLVSYLEILAAVTVIGMLVAVLISSWLQSLVTRPILAIAGIAREVVGQRAYSRRADKLSDDEVGTLVDAFNDMLGEIERRTAALESSNQELAREVNERRRAEEEVLRLNADLEDRVRERTAQLEMSNGELEAFSYSVSHDLRAPLRAIDGFGQMLLQDFPETTSEKARHYLSRITSATQRMGQLIEDLLNLSRVARAEIGRTKVDLSVISREVLSELQQRAPERNVDISIWEGMTVECDARLLRAALENLLNNAWKFTSKIERARIEVGSLRDGSRTVYFVRDNGAGFDMAYANKLFGAFQRLHRGSEYAGTGIGLATVQRIIHRHGGRIWADASPGKGAVFFFTLAPDNDSHEQVEPVAASV